MIKPVILWTDALIFVLIAVVSLFVVHAHRQAHLREPWQRVLKSRLGMASLVIVLAYVAVGMLDSIHFRKALPDNGNGGSTHYSGEVLSLLDLWMGPVRTQVEKSYSAPFATHLFIKLSVTDAEGRTVRAYPRLAYGGAHLDDPAERAADLRERGLRAVGQWLVAMGALTLLLALLLARRRREPIGRVLQRILRGQDPWPWRSFLAAFGAVLAVLFFAIHFAAAYHVLGTDKVGQDVFYQAVKSIRTGLVIGTLTTLVMLPFAILLGIMAGYFRGWVDDVIQYLYTTLNSIPGVLLIAAAILMLQVYMANHPELFETMAERADIRLLFLCVILGITSWTGLCRMLRGETFKLREVDFIEAATAFGVRHRTIILRHILPNVMHIVLIAVVLDFSGLVLAEAVLSYVGVGVDPSMISWGNMINRARLEMAREPMVWWSLLAAFLFMFTLVLAANLLSDAVRDAFDPRLRRTR